MPSEFTPLDSKHLTGFIAIFMTASSKKEAKRIISSLIKKRLVACANLLNDIDSTFIWKDKIDKAREVLAVFKTKRSLFDKVTAEIKRLHSYEVPEIIAIPIIEGSKEYLEWIDKSVKSEIRISKSETNENTTKSKYYQIPNKSQIPNFKPLGF